MAAQPDVEGLREKWNLPLVFVEGDLGGPLLGVSRNRIPFNVKFRFTLFGPMHFSTAAEGRILEGFFFCLLLLS